MSKYTQDDEPLAIETPLGKDALLLESFKGQETLSGLFHFELTCLSVEDQIDDTKIVGKKVSFRVDNGSGKARWFTGYVKQFSWAGRNEKLTMWNLVVVPSLWFTSLTSDCKIFQEKSTPDILSAVLGDCSELTVSKKLSESYSPWEYCVQYQETDLAFVSRLMEFAGMTYFFEHAKNSLSMVIADSNSAFTDCDDGQVEAIQDFSSPDEPGQLITWKHDHSFRSGKFVQTDYNFEDPSTDLLVTSKGKSPYPSASNAELFDYPGDYIKKSDGESLGKYRIEAAELLSDVASGKSSCRSFSPGYTFKIGEHPNSSEKGKKYLLIKVSHRGSNKGVYGTAPESEVAFSYENTFECVPSETVARVPQSTPWPSGTVQTALVVGPSGEEIYTDEYGRIKVQFYWDRYGEKNEQSSCWIRVSQSLAGPQFGSQFLPRVGMEVVVSHLDNNPNRPLVTGVVYNGTNKPPFTLPDSAAQSGIQTRSTKDGQEDQANQLIFDDTKDSEMVTFHAQKDFTRVVENDDSVEVGFDTKDKGDRSVKVYNNLTEEIGSDGCDDGTRSMTVYKDNQTTVSTGDETYTVKQGDATYEVTKGKQAITVGKGQVIEVGDGHSLTVKSGDHTLSVNSGSGSMKATSWTIEGTQSITLKVGSNSIEIGPSGINIKGTTVSVKGNTSASVEGLTTSIKGTTALTQSGAIIKIG